MPRACAARPTVRKVARSLRQRHLTTLSGPFQTRRTTAGASLGSNGRTPRGVAQSRSTDRYPRTLRDPWKGCCAVLPGNRIHSCSQVGGLPDRALRPPPSGSPGRVPWREKPARRFLPRRSKGETSWERPLCAAHSGVAQKSRSQVFRNGVHGYSFAAHQRWMDIDGRWFVCDERSLRIKLRGKSSSSYPRSCASCGS